MFSSGPSYNKLKTNLRLCINRLKMLEKKKTELAFKARKEISDYIASGKEDRARIRVEHIVREDYYVEGMELVEMYCDLLLARFGLITTQKEVDPGLEEAIASIMWATPRLQADIPELKPVFEQLRAKYSKEYADACLANSLGKVSEKLQHKLSVQAPPKLLIEKYMEEIAKTYNVPFVPDPMVTQEDEIAFAERLIALDDGGAKQPNGPPPLQPQPAPAAPTPFNYPPPGPSYPGSAPNPNHQLMGAVKDLTDALGGLSDTVIVQAPGFMPPSVHYQPPHQQGGMSAPPPSMPGYPQGPPPPIVSAASDLASAAGYMANTASSGPPPPPSVPPSGPPPNIHPGGGPSGGPPPYPIGGAQPPPYNGGTPTHPASGNDQAGPLPTKSTLPDLPDLPAVPGSIPGGSAPPPPSAPGGGGSAGGGSNDVDFDDLTRRFEELKKKK